MFGQFVIGPPGSGKTTYCKTMCEFLISQGRRVAVVNLDPANDLLPYTAAIDISDLITLGDSMEAMKLGPNGGLMFCMEFLDQNSDWLLEKLKSLPPKTYVIFDCPGQIELYSHHAAVRNILHRLQSTQDFHFCAVHLVDSQCCSDPGKFISVLCTSLSSMLNLEIPLIHCLSKVDLIDVNGELPFSVEYFSEVFDLSYLLDRLDQDPFYSQFRALNKALIGVIEDRSLVSFALLDIQDKQSLDRMKRLVDKANGYVYGSGEERNMSKLLSTSLEVEHPGESSAMVEEKYTTFNKKLEKMDDIDWFA